MQCEHLARVRRLVARRRIPRRFTPVVFAFYMASIMAFLMTLAITLINQGITPGFVGTVLRSYVLAMPVAFIGVIIVRPLVVRLVAWSIDKEAS
ncbi:DUF2798 domain-containing protein [Halomonas sp. PA5]|nr:DUF2798 domain-containing protein [Halomonas sp. PA5]